MRKLLSLYSPFPFQQPGPPRNVARGRKTEHELHPRAGSREKATLASAQEACANAGCT